MGAIAALLRIVQGDDDDFHHFPVLTTIMDSLSVHFYASKNRSGSPSPSLFPRLWIFSIDQMLMHFNANLVLYNALLSDKPYSDDHQ